VKKRKKGVGTGGKRVEAVVWGGGVESRGRVKRTRGREQNGGGGEG